MANQAILPLLREGGDVQSLANYYTDQFFTIDNVNINASDIAAALKPLRLGSDFGKISSLNISGLHEGEFLYALYGGMKQAGFVTEIYAQNGNWFFTTQNGFEAYWEERSSQLQNMVKRRCKKLKKQGDIEIIYFQDVAEHQQACDLYHDVAREGWQPEEPHDKFLPSLINWILSEKIGFLCVLESDGVPLAAQIWLTAGGRATLFKLAHKKQARQLSPGTVLTYSAIKNIFDMPEISMVDFGRGDDPYKKAWSDLRAQCWGVNAYNISTLGGGIGAVRNIGAKILLGK